MSHYSTNVDRPRDLKDAFNIILAGLDDDSVCLALKHLLFSLQLRIENSTVVVTLLVVTNYNSRIQ